MKPLRETWLFFMSNLRASFRSGITVYRSVSARYLASSICSFTCGN